MAAPPRYRDIGGLPGSSAAPAIFIEASSDRFAAADRSDLYGSSVAMSIPGSVDPRDAPPPPLPPPKMFTPDGLPYNEEPRSFHRGPPSFSPHDGSHVGSIGSFMEDHKRRQSNGSKFKTDRDEGYASLSSAGSIRYVGSELPGPSPVADGRGERRDSGVNMSCLVRSENSLPSFGQLHNRFQLASGADALVDMKKKLDPLRTIDNKLSSGRSLLNDALSRSPMENRLPALSLPSTQSGGLLESPDRFTQTAHHSAISPLSHASFSGAGFGPGGYRSPNSTSDNERSPPSRTKRINSDDVSTQGSYGTEDMDVEEASMNRLRIDEYPLTGSKRRACSPPSEMNGALPSLTTQGDMLRRRDVSSRGSPTPRLGPVSEAPITAAARNRSFNLSLFTGNTLPVGGSSYGKLSPGGLSPGALSGGLSPVATDHSCSSPYSTPLSTNPSPRGSLSRAPHQRNASETRPFASPRKLTEVSKPNGAKMQGFYMCECCPKKPKKFESPEELR